jgi:hypothetical protein
MGLVSLHHVHASDADDAGADMPAQRHAQTEGNVNLSIRLLHGANANISC